MKPKLYFVATSIVLAVGFVLTLGFATFAVNLVSWHIRNDRPFDFIGFGRPGIGPFFGSFPWILLLVAVILIAVGFRMSREFDFSYRRNTVILALLIAFIPMSLGIAADMAGFGDIASRHNLGRKMYRMRDSGGNWLFGTISSSGVNYFTVQTSTGPVTVEIDKDTFIPPFGQILASGSFVRVVGDFQGDTFKAKAIKPGMPRGKMRNSQGALVPFPPR